MRRLKDYNLVVIASTYPRWPNDSMRSFVQDYVNGIFGHFKSVRVIVPHYKGAKHSERPAENIRLTRFYYTFPFRYENIAYGEFKKTWGYSIKAALYNASELWSTLLAGLRLRPLILNPHWMIPQGFVAVLLKPILRCKVVVSVHGADIYTLNSKLMKKVKRFVLRRADEVIVNSSATHEACQKLLARDYYIIPMGVDTSTFKARPAKQAREIFEVLFVGRLAEQKGVMYLCEAARLLKEQDVAVHTTFVGEGEAQKQIEAFVAKHGLAAEITLAGWVQHDALAGYYAKADVFVGPSIESKDGWQEAFGLVFAEASAIGVPVITTATGGIKDIVHDNINGLVVPQKDAGALAEAITRLINAPELCLRLGAAGPKFISENFAWPVIISKYKAIFEKLI